MPATEIFAMQSAGPPPHPSVTFLSAGSTAELLELVPARHFAVVPGRRQNAVEKFALLPHIALA